MLLRIALICAVISLTGCAMVPESIDVSEESQLISYTRAVSGGETTVGQPARWGGIITSVENKPGKTLVEIVHFPLNSYGKPVSSEETVGRFKAVFNNFVDPIVFETGRTVTFVGTVGEMSSGMVGEQPYMYPTLVVDDYYIWRKQSAYDASSVYVGFYNGWYSPFYYPYYRPFGMYHSNHRVVIREPRGPKRPSSTRRMKSPETNQGSPNTSRSSSKASQQR
jgi:outer membrane lipoprotein